MGRHWRANRAYSAEMEFRERTSKWVSIGFLLLFGALGGCSLSIGAALVGFANVGTTDVSHIRINPR